MGHPNFHYTCDVTHQLTEGRFIEECLRRGFSHIRSAHWRTAVISLAERPGPPAIWSRQYAEAAYEIVETDGCLVMLDVFAEEARLSVLVAGPPRRLATAVATVRAWCPEIAQPEDDRVNALFWANDDDAAPMSAHRSLAISRWPEISRNYAGRTRAGLDALLAATEPPGGGRMILWHGEPGTGKTWALRALGFAWRAWCSLDVVTDPEVFFSSPRYMLKVLDGKRRKRPWQLVVLEDTGELLAADAKSRMGQGLSRFLNLTDGLLGQGLNTLVLVTTNEPVSTLHPAVARPGRVLQLLEFQRLSTGESRDWLAARGVEAPIASPQTLAELFAITDGRAHRRTERRVGFRPSRGVGL